MTLLPPMARYRTPSSRMHQSWGAPVRSKIVWRARRAATCSSRSSRLPSRRALRIARGILFGLQQAGDDERLVPAQDRSLGFDIGPLLELAVQALFLALPQVV